MDDAMSVIRDMVTDIDGEDRPILELLAEALQTTADEVIELDAAGSVTLKLTVKPERKHGRTTLSISPDLSRSAPKRKLDGVIRFNRNGRLSRNDTQQPRLPMRAVEPTPSTVREPNADTTVREG